MADTTMSEPEAMPPDWTPEDEAPAVATPDVSAAMIDDLATLREERAAEHDHDFALPGFDDKMWATYKLLGPKRVMSMMTAFADPSLKDSELTYRAAKFLSDAATAVFMRFDGRRLDFPGHSEEAPALWVNLPARLVPPRPAGRPHDGPSSVRTLFGRDTIVVGHALDVAGWMQSADKRVAEEFSGESEGGPR